MNTQNELTFQIAIFLILYLQARGLAVFNRSKHFLVIPLLQVGTGYHSICVGGQIYLHIFFELFVWIVKLQLKLTAAK